MFRFINSTKNNICLRNYSKFLKFKGGCNEIYINTNQIKYIQKNKIKSKENIFVGHKDKIIKIPKYNNYYKIYLKDNFHLKIFDNDINYKNIDYFLKSKK